MIRLALTKGRIEESAVELLQKSGYNTDCLKKENKGRKLLFNIDDKIEIVLAKAADVITYVEHGVCDAGIVGKDTILESERSFYEIADLGFGKCRFALAGPVGKTLYDNSTQKIIATKYPTVTKNYFNSLGLDVEIVKIEGSVELAPILGLADAIVDIVETGSTLKANGLEIYDDVCDISARLIVNVASVKLKKAEIDDFSYKMINASREN